MSKANSKHFRAQLFLRGDFITFTGPVAVLADTRDSRRTPSQSLLQVIYQATQTIETTAVPFSSCVLPQSDRYYLDEPRLLPELLKEDCESTS
jgi:hypothetical protein